MIVYEGIKSDFIRSIEDGTIAETIERKVYEKLGRHTGKSEFRSWDNSMQHKVKIGYGIRQIGIALTDLTYEPDMQLSFFENHEDDENEIQLEVAMVGIRNKYGKNALLKGFNLFEKATGIKRNTMVGGHNG